MSTPGKLELTIKINKFPSNVKTVKNGWKQFEINTGRHVVTLVITQNDFRKLEQAQKN